MSLSCSRCGTPLHQGNRVNGRCRACVSAYERAAICNNPGRRAKEVANSRRYRLRRWYARLVTNIRRTDPAATITPEQVLELFRRQNGRCYWFNVPLRPTSVARAPGQPSLDRLDNTKPHTFENCVLASYAANIGRNSTPVAAWKTFVRRIHRHKPACS